MKKSLRILTQAMNIKGQKEISLPEKKDISNTSFNDIKTIKIENSPHHNGESQNNFNLPKSSQIEKSDGRLSINKRSEYESITTPIASDTAVSDRLKSAIDRYRYQAQLNPDSAIIQTNLGKLYHKNQQFAEAVHCYKKAITIDQDYSLAHQYLAQIPMDKVCE